MPRKRCCGTSRSIPRKKLSATLRCFSKRIRFRSSSTVATSYGEPPPKSLCDTHRDIEDGGRFTVRPPLIPQIKAGLVGVQHIQAELLTGLQQLPDPWVAIELLLCSLDRLEYLDLRLDHLVRIEVPDVTVVEWIDTVLLQIRLGLRHLSLHPLDIFSFGASMSRIHRRELFLVDIVVLPEGPKPDPALIRRVRCVCLHHLLHEHIVER